MSGDGLDVRGKPGPSNHGTTYWVALDRTVLGPVGVGRTGSRPPDVSRVEWARLMRVNTLLRRRNRRHGCPMVPWRHRIILPHVGVGFDRSDRGETHREWLQRVKAEQLSIAGD